MTNKYTGKELEIAKSINYNQILEDDLTTGSGGISYEGETLKDFMEEVGLPLGETRLLDINKALKECGIKEVGIHNNNL